MDNKLLLLLAVAPILLALLIVLIDRRRTRKTMDTIEQMLGAASKAVFLRWKPNFPTTSPPAPSPRKM